jgi:hypothetical protein
MADLAPEVMADLAAEVLIKDSDDTSPCEVAHTAIMDGSYSGADADPDRP